jgi:hypothetical protein
MILDLKSSECAPVIFLHQPLETTQTPTVTAYNVISARYMRSRTPGYSHHHDTLTRPDPLTHATHRSKPYSLARIVSVSNSLLYHSLDGSTDEESVEWAIQIFGRCALLSLRPVVVALCLLVSSSTLLRINDVLSSSFFIVVCYIVIYYLYYILYFSIKLRTQYI